MQVNKEHVEDSDKHIIEETVRQVAHLPELYEDARSEKYKKITFVLYGTGMTCSLVNTLLRTGDADLRF